MMSAVKLQGERGCHGFIAIPQIHDLVELDKHLCPMAQAIFDCTGSQNLEWTYENCLLLDLKKAGLEVQSQIAIPLTYKSEVVGPGDL